MRRYTTKPLRGYTDAENDGYWPDGECSGYEAIVEDNDDCTGIFAPDGGLIYRQRQPVGFHLRAISQKRSGALKRLADK